jgi:hypothetical protein
MPNTQEKELKPRPDRPLTNTCHEVVEAHGEQHPDHVQESDFDGHLTGEFEHAGENDQRVVKASKVTLGRHVTSKNGLLVAAERKASNESARKEHQKAWDSDKKSVVPERKK